VGLIAGGTAVVVLALLHLFAPATVAAAFVLPLLYLIYLYEVEVYESEPWLVVGATMVAGAILGYAFTSLVSDALARSSLTADRETAFVLTGVTIPIAGQALMLVGPVFLYVFRGRLREPLDGLTFGAASALAFTMASSLTAFWPLLEGPLVGTGSPLDWIVRLTQVGLLNSLFNASTTALVAAALWLQRYDRRRANRDWQSGMLGAIIVAFGAQIAIGMLGFAVDDLAVRFGIVLLATLALLLYVRLVIHQALMVEGAEHEIGPDAPCPECHRVVPAMAFCPACGVARTATSKQGRPGAAGRA
jgi:hypothetical protein